MKVTSILFAAVAVASSFVAAAPLAEPSVKPACFPGPCGWKREAAPEPVAAPEPEPSVKPACFPGPCGWKREAEPEPVAIPEPSVKPACFPGPCGW